MYHALQVQREIKGVVLLNLYIGVVWGCVGVQRHVPAALPLEGSAVPIVQEAGCAQGPVWTSVFKRECLAPTGVRSPNVQAVASHYTDYTIPASYLECC